MSLRTECSLFQRREGFCATERVLKICCDFMTNFYGCALREIGKKIKNTGWGNRCSWHYLMHKSLLGVGGSGGTGMCTTFLFKGFRQKPTQLKWIYLVTSNAYCCCYYYSLQTKIPEFVEGPGKEFGLINVDHLSLLMSQNQAISTVHLDKRWLKYTQFTKKKKKNVITW